MKVQIDVHPDDAVALVKFLNDDQGLRNAVADKMLPQNKPENVSKFVSIINGLGAVSRGLTLALQHDAAMTAAVQKIKTE